MCSISEGIFSAAAVAFIPKVVNLYYLFCSRRLFEPDPYSKLRSARFSFFSRSSLGKMVIENVRRSSLGTYIARLHGVNV